MKTNAMTFVLGVLMVHSLSGVCPAQKQPGKLKPNIRQALPAKGAMLIGVDYYPEHWPRERWETDMKLMKEAGFNTVRLAEFSWIKMEPVEGRFEFDWLDDAVTLLARHGMNVILGTPTAVMPAWVARTYPETLRQKPDGTRILSGGRRTMNSGAENVIVRAVLRSFRIG
jgi:beta-galactosidase